MPRMELPENWGEMTPDEQNEFYHENARAPKNWGNKTKQERSDYFHYTCDCADIIYEDIWDYLMTIPRFKQAYTNLKSPYNLRSKHFTYSAFKGKAIDILVVTILDEMEQYSRNGVEDMRCPALIESCRDFYTQGHLKSVQKKHWFSIDQKLSNNVNNDKAFPYYQQVYYEPTLRSYYDRPCKCSFIQYNQWDTSYGDIEEEDICISCNTFIDMELMVRGCFTAILMNLFTDSEIKKQILRLIEISNGWTEVLKQKLIELSKNYDLIFTNYWKGANYYYKKLFFSSIYLDSLNIPHKILRQKYEWNFDAMICGHPKASHGWFAEVKEELEKIMKEQNKIKPIFLE